MKNDNSSFGYIDTFVIPKIHNPISDFVYFLSNDKIIRSNEQKATETVARLSNDQTQFTYVGDYHQKQFINDLADDDRFKNNSIQSAVEADLIFIDQTILIPNKIIASNYSSIIKLFQYSNNIATIKSIQTFSSVDKCVIDLLFMRLIHSLIHRNRIYQQVNKGIKNG